MSRFRFDRQRLVRPSRVGSSLSRRLRFEQCEERCLLSVASPQLELFSVSPALFVENQGQWADESVRFVHQGDGANVAMTDAGVLFEVFRREEIAGANAESPDELPPGLPDDRFLADNYVTHTLQFSASFVGANTVAPVGEDQAETLFNYYVGAEEDWRSGVTSYEVVAYQGLYDGIDLHTWGQSDSLKYEFHVAPGADYTQIQVHYSGITGLVLGDNGSLRVDLGGDWGELVDDAPFIYQVIDGQQVEVAGRFELIDANTYTFLITGSYDASHEVVIDPDIAWASYLGGSNDDYGRGIAVDDAGNALLTGYTFSSNFPTPGGFDTSYNGGSYDAFVAKVTAGGALAWASYLSGNGRDVGNGIAVDAAGNALLTGETSSSNFPTPGGFDTSYSSYYDAFVAKVTADGALAWASYLGGNGYDRGHGIAVDAAGNALLTGSTHSSNFPTPGGFDTGNNGGYWDAFVAKVTADGSLAWASYLGGNGYDHGRGIAVDAAGNALLTGETSSSNFPTPGGFDTSYNGGSYDAFVAKVTAGGALAWASYLGGSSSDVGYSIAVDAAGNALLTGETSSSNFPTPGGFDTSYSSYYDAFVAKVTADGALAWASYLGGNGYDRGHGIAVDAAGNALLTGSTHSSNFPTPGGFDTGNNGGYWDAFVAKVTAGGALAWASYLGGSSSDVGYSIAVDAAGNALLTGWTSSSNFPTPGGFDTSLSSYNDAFVAKVTADGSLAWASYLGGSSSDVGYSIAVDAAGNALLTGYTESSNFPTPGGFDTSYYPGGDAFVAKISGAGTPVDANDTLASSDNLGTLTSGSSSVRSAQIGDGAYGSKDVDLCRFSITTAGMVTVDIDARASGSALDAYLRLFSSDGVPMAANDDHDGQDPYLSLFLAAGTYYVGVSGYPNKNYSPFVGGSGVSADSAGPYTLTVALASAPPLSLGDSDLERIARDVAYRHWTVGSVVNVLDYRVAAVFDLAAGFNAVALASTSSLPPVLAIRGTEIGGGLDVWDILDDTNTQGIGSAQFTANRQTIENWLLEECGDGLRPYIVGHSLGGALSQWFAADFTDRYDYLLGEVVTFNSPGISNAFADRFQADETAGVTHYITSGDIVSLAGQAFIQGDYKLFTYDEPFSVNPVDYVINKHCTPILFPSYTGSDGKTYQHPSGAALPVTGSLAWLNSPFYSYTDPEHLIFVSAMTVATTALMPSLSYIPASFLFRGTTEAVRTQFGTIFETVSDGMNLGITANGLWVDLPDTSLALPGGLSLETEDLSVTYIAGSLPRLKAQGHGSLGIPPLGEVWADFSGSNYISFSDVGVAVVGEIGMMGPIIVGPGFSLKDIRLQMNTLTNKWYGEGTLMLPAGFGVEVGVGFLDGKLNDATVGFVDLNKPIIYGPPPAPVPLVFLQDGAASLWDFAPGPPPVKLQGDLALTFGPKIGDYYLMELGLSATYDTAGRITGVGTVRLGGGDDPFEFASAQVIVDKAFGLYVSGSMSLVGLMDLAGAARVGLDGKLQGSFAGEVHAPAWVGGWSLAAAKAYAQYMQDADTANDYLIAGGQALGMSHAVSVNLNTGKLDWWADYGKLQSITVTPPSGASSDGSGIRPAAASEPHAFALPTGLQQALFRIEWGQGDTDIELIDPLGNVYTPSNVAGNPNIKYYKNTATHEAVYEIVSPAGGAWMVTVTEVDGIGGYTLESRRLSRAPTIGILEPSLDSAGGPVSITWTDEDSDSDAMISLYYDTDRSGADGTLITSGISHDAGPDSFVWNVASVPSGSYYVYAVIDDGTNLPAISYSTGRVTVVDADAPPPVTGLNAPEGTKTSAKLTWEASTATDLHHYLVRLTADAAGEQYTRVVAATESTLTVDGLTTGETYRVTVAAVDADGHVSADSAPIVVVAGAVATVPPAAGEWAVFAQPGSTYHAQVPGGAGDTYNLVAGPAGATVDAIGLFSWSVPAGTTGWHEVVVHVTATDGSVAVRRYYLLTDADPPQWSTTTVNGMPLGDTSIQLTAPVAIDASGMLQYQWERNGVALPGWSLTPDFTNTGLNPDSVYQFRARTKDSSPAGQVSAWSDVLSIRTLAAVPDAPVVNAPTVTSVVIAGLSANGNPASTEYAVFNVTTAQYVAADGSGSATAVWRSASAWVNTIVIGLQSDTEYAFQTQAHNGDGTASDLGAITVVRTIRETVPPTVTDASYSAATQQVTLTFSEPVAISLKDLVLKDSTQAVIDLASATLTYVTATHQAIVTLRPSVNDGGYSLTIKGTSVQDLAANLLDGDGNGTPGGDYVYTFLAVVPPIIASWSSVATHAGVGEANLDIADDGDFTEARSEGVTRLWVTFSEAIDPTMFTSAAVQIAGTHYDGSAVDLSAIIITTDLRDGNTVGVIDFSTALPGVAKYTVRIDGVTDLAGNALVGDNDRVFAALKGDVSGDGVVNAVDLARVRANNADPILTASAAQIRADLSLDGRVDSLDLSWVRDHIGNDARGIVAPSLPATIPASADVEAESPGLPGDTEIILPAPGNPIRIEGPVVVSEDEPVIVPQAAAQAEDDALLTDATFAAMDVEMPQAAPGESATTPVGHSRDARQASTFGYGRALDALMLDAIYREYHARSAPQFDGLLDDLLGERVGTPGSILHRQVRFWSARAVSLSR